MSVNSIPTILDLPLDEILNNNVLDHSGNMQAVTLYGSPEIVPDDMMGSCMAFDGTGDYLELPGTDALMMKNNSFTATAWVKCTGLTNEDQPIFGNAQTGDNTCLYFLIRNKKPYMGFYSNDTAGVTVLQEGRWYHLAFVYDHVAQTQTIYVDGVQDACGQNKIPFQGSQPLLIGQRYDNLYFKGQIAHVRVYDSVLTPGQVNDVMKKALTAEATFKLEYPMDFNLLDADERNILYISNEAALNNFSLEIENTSALSLVIAATGNTIPSVDNHHLELKFKPKTFAEDLDGTKKYFKPGTLPADWAVGDAVKNEDDGKVSIYLLYTGVDFTLGAGNKLVLPFQYKSADPTGGARGSNMQLLYKNLHYENDAAEITGSRIRSIDIINQRGKKNLPLHVGIIGSNTILNDAASDEDAASTRSAVTIRLANTLKNDPLVFSTGNADPDLNTKFTLLFDDPVGTDWDLASEAQLKDITLKCKFPGNTTGIDVIPNLQGVSPVFEFDAPLSQLEAAQAIDLELSNIRTGKPSGFANIYIKYEDIPGYWDGQFSVQVEKSPIVHTDVGDNKHVGIGITPDSTHRLAVKGDTNITGTLTTGGTIDLNSDSGNSLTLSSSTIQDGGLHIQTQAGYLLAGPRNGGYCHFYTDRPKFYFSNGLSVNSGSIESYDDDLKLKTAGTTRVRIEKSSGDVAVNNNLDVAGVISGKGIVPIGTVIDWYRPTAQTPIPAGWVIADGRTFTQADVDNAICDASLLNKTIPNLNDRFVRGVTDPNHAGCTYGGWDTHYHYINFNTQNSGNHNHQVLRYDAYKKIYSYLADGTEVTVHDWGNGFGHDGSGLYCFGGESFQDFYTKKEGTHTHSVVGDSGYTRNVPSYVGLLKLIRVL